eukprot:Sspe_Gene.67059::Locus_39589_Transcript_1_1_Confidence_1.000_Length_742::g.67059::m.67059
MGQPLSPPLDEVACQSLIAHLAAELIAGRQLPPPDSGANDDSCVECGADHWGEAEGGRLSTAEHHTEEPHRRGDEAWDRMAHAEQLAKQLVEVAPSPHFAQQLVSAMVRGGTPQHHRVERVPYMMAHVRHYHRHCDGLYKPTKAVQHRRPVWKHARKRLWMFHSPDGRWMITDDPDDFAHGTGFLAENGRGAQLPSDVAMWARGDGRAWHLDPT